MDAATSARPAPNLEVFAHRQLRTSSLLSPEATASQPPLAIDVLPILPDTVFGRDNGRCSSVM